MKPPTRDGNFIWIFISLLELFSTILPESVKYVVKRLLSTKILETILQNRLDAKKFTQLKSKNY